MPNARHTTYRMTTKTVNIGGRLVGDGQPCLVIAEVGINHNGDVGIAQRLINASANAGCELVKFQKRTVEAVYTREELDKPRESPFGTTNGDLKHGLEFGAGDYAKIDLYCAEHGVMWFASCWDRDAVTFVERFNPPAYKIASASLTDAELLKVTCATGKPIILVMPHLSSPRGCKGRR